MNVELMLQVADHIETHYETYNQSEWCGTTCCIAGHALCLAYAVEPTKVLAFAMDKLGLREIIMTPSLQREWAAHVIPRMAAQLLDLDEDTADELFAGGGFWPQPFSLAFRLDSREKASLAAAFIRHLVKQEQYRRSIVSVAMQITNTDELLVPANDGWQRVEVEDEELVPA